MANSLVWGLRLRFSAIVVHSRSPRSTQSEIVSYYAHSRSLVYGVLYDPKFTDLDENFHFFMIFPYWLGNFPEIFRLRHTMTLEIVNSLKKYTVSTPARDAVSVVNMTIACLTVMH